jgi:uncharacterized protein (TIGR00369 family)
MTAAGHDADRGRDVGRYVGVTLRETEEGRVEGRSLALDHLRGPAGGVRAGALITMLDFVGGLCGGLAALPDGWVVSTNLAATLLPARHVGPLRIEAEVWRKGRNNVVTGVRLYDEGARDALVVDGVLTSAILIPENGPPPWTRPLVITPGDAWSAPEPDLVSWIGARATDASTIEIALADELRNPWGILHGGVVATLVDLAAEHATGRVTSEIVLHFLAPNRIGPVRAVAQPHDDRTARVEIRDQGADRVTAVAITRG